MKILQIMSGFELHYQGGITNYVRSLCDSLTSNGHQTTVICNSADSKSDDSIKIIKYSAPRQKVFSYKFARKNSADIIFDNDANPSNYDLIHIHSIYGLSLNAINKITQSETPYIFSIHDYYAFCPKIFMLNRESKPCRSYNSNICRNCIGILDSIDGVRALEKRGILRAPFFPSNTVRNRNIEIAPFFNKASKILAVSKRVKELFLQAYPNTRTEAITIGNISSNWPEIKKSKSEKIRISFLGTLNIQKGGRLLIEFIEKTNRNDIEFHFYGRVSPTFEEEISGKNLINHGPYKQDDLINILRDTDIGMVLPIWEDNGPQVVMEILNSGTPIIATKVGGIPDFANSQSFSILFNPDSKIEIQDTIKWLQGVKKEEIEKMGANINKLKSPQEHSNEITTIYQNILNNRTE